MSHEPESLPKRLAKALQNEEEAHLDTVRAFDDFMFAVVRLVRKVEKCNEDSFDYFNFCQIHGMPYRGEQLAEELNKVRELLLKEGYQPSDLMWRDDDAGL